MKSCPNCETPNEETAQYCGGCGANLQAKKYKKADDPILSQKKLEELETENKKLKSDVETIKKHLQEKDDNEQATASKPKRTLFGN